MDLQIKVVRKRYLMKQNTEMTNTHIKSIQNHLLPEQIKTIVRSYYPPSRMAKI